MDSCMVGTGAAHDDGDIKLVNELFQIQGLMACRHMLGRNRRTAYNKQVNTGVKDS